MFVNLRTVKVYVWREAVDMRKGHDGLSGMVRNHMQLDVLSGAVFVFLSRSRKTAKALLWDGTGLCVFHKRLERGRFMTFRGFSSVETLTMAELSLLLSGSKLVLPLALPEFTLGSRAAQKPHEL